VGINMLFILQIAHERFDSCVKSDEDIRIHVT